MRALVNSDPRLSDSSSTHNDRAIMRTDTELWQAVLSNEKVAWKSLIERFQPLVYAVVVRAGLSTADASDCFQQTWVLLFQNRHKIKDPGRLSAWLVTTARREALRAIRREKRFADDTLMDELRDEDPLPDEQLERLELQAELERALSQLDMRCQNLLRAIFFDPENHSYEEIAGNLGLAINSLGPIRRRCLERLEKVLSENGYLAVRNRMTEPLSTKREKI